MSAAAISQLMTREEWDELSFRLKGLPRGHWVTQRKRSSFVLWPLLKIVIDVCALLFLRESGEDTRDDTHVLMPLARSSLAGNSAQWIINRLSLSALKEVVMNASSKWWEICKQERWALVKIECSLRSLSLSPKCSAAQTHGINLTADNLNADASECEENEMRFKVLPTENPID